MMQRHIISSLTPRTRPLFHTFRSSPHTRPFSPHQLVERRNLFPSAVRSFQSQTDSIQQVPEHPLEHDEVDEVDDDGEGKEEHKILFDDFADALVNYSTSINVNEYVKPVQRSFWSFTRPEKQLKRQHDALWRSIYHRIRAPTATSSSAMGSTSTSLIPLVEDVPAALRRSGFITNPPISGVNLIFADKEDYEPCPCLLPSEELPTIRLQAHETITSHGTGKPGMAGERTPQQGITFDMLLSRLCEAMHGHDDGSPALIGGKNDLLRLHQFDWMITPRFNLYGENIFIYIEGCSLWK